MAKGRKDRRAGLAGSGSDVRSRATQPSGGRRAAVYWLVAIGVTAVAIYLNAPGNDFVLDDIRLIRDNTRIRSLANVPRLFTSSYWDLQGAQALYRPLVLATYALNYAVHGLSPNGYTVVNIALHATVALMLFALVRGMDAPLPAAGLAGMLFAVHPVHTEAVTGISGRPELLAAAFFLLALHLHRLAPGSLHRAIVLRAGTVASFVCALLSKESAITFLLVVPALDVLVPVRDRRGAAVTARSRLVPDYLPLAAAAVAYLVVRRLVLGSITIPEAAIAPLDNPLVPMTTMPLGERMGATPAQALMTAFAVVGQYARLLVWPARLSPDYSYAQIPLVTSAFDARFIIGIALAAACVVGILLLVRRAPIAAFGLAFLALTFSIVSNLVITIGTICAERLLYLPSAGVCIAVAAAAGHAAGTPGRRRRLAAVMAVVIVLGAVRTWTRNRDWMNERTLWSAALQTAPRSARVQSEYGRVLLEQAQDEAQAGHTAQAEGLYRDAQTHFEQAIAIFPSYSLPIDGLAMIASVHERYDEALPLYARALKAWPGNYASLTNWASAEWERARRIGTSALALRQQGRTVEADGLVREADAQFREALQKIDRAIAMMPSYAPAHLVRATMLETYVGDIAGAIAEFEEVIRLQPNHPQRALIDEELQRLRSQLRRDG